MGWTMVGRHRLTAALSVPVVAAVGVSSATAAASAASAPEAAGDWRPRQVVNLDYKDSKNVDDESSDIAMTADGTTVAVWNRQVGRRLLVEGARRPAGGSWSPPTVLARTEAVGSAGETDLFVDAVGNVTVGYSDYLDTGTAFRSLVRTWRADGSVGPVTELDRGSLVFGPLLYGDAHGDVLAVVGNGGDRPHTYYRPLGKPWSGGSAFPSRTNPTLADFVLGPGSEVLAVWSGLTDDEADPGDILTSTLGADGWAPPDLIGGGPGEVWDVDAEANVDGDIGVSWVRQTPSVTTDDVVEAAFRPAGKSWGPVEVVHRVKRDVEEAASTTTVGIDAAGVLTVAWRQRYSPAIKFNLPLRSASRTSAGGWSRPQTLTPRCDAYGVQVSVNAGGDAQVICSWSTLYRGRIESVQRPAGEAWHDSTPVTRSLGGFEGGWLFHGSDLSDAGEAVLTYQSTESRAIWSKSSKLT